MREEQRVSGVRLVGGRGACARELIREVPDLGALVEGLSNLVKDLEGQVTRARAELAERVAERAEIDRRREAKVAALVRRLEQESERLRREFEEGASECDELDRVREQVDAEARTLMERCVALDTEVNHATALYVASERLLSTKTRESAVLAIEEVAATLIGCEELAVLEVTPPPRSLRVVSSLGVGADEIARLDPAAEPISGALESGSVWVAPGDGDRARGSPRLSACAPLADGDSVVGVVAMFGLLEQKTALDVRDREILALLSRHAGRALATCAARASELPTVRPRGAAR